MTLRKRTLCCVCILCNAMRLCGLRLKHTLFFTYCTLLLLLYAPHFWNTSIFTKLIVRRSEACSDWPAIQCIVIGQIPQAWDGNVTPLTVLFCHVNLLHPVGQLLIIMTYTVFCTSAFVIGETTNNKHYTTLLKTHVWIVSSKFFKQENALTGCESEAPDCPC